MIRAARFFDTILIYASVFLVCVFFIPFFIVLCLLPRSKKFTSTFFHQSTYWFFRAIMVALRIKVVYKGFGHKPEKPVIFIANHQSSLDIIAIGSAVSSFPLIWFARSELEESLLLKIVLRCFAIVAEVNDPQKSALSLRRLLGLLKNSVACPVIFPEGSRYNDGLIHEFFKGFAFLARATNRAVIPILIENAFKVYPRGAFLVQREFLITLTQGPEFSILREETLDAFGARVRDWFLKKGR